MLEALLQVDLRFLTHQQKLAFWLNIYNTCIMHGFLQHDLPSNSEKMLALKNKATINVSGQKFNALVIENFILRQPSSVKEEFWKCDVDVKEQQVRGLYGLDSSEPNILFAMCCGTRSSPAVSSCTCLLPDAGGPRPPPQNNWKAPPSPTQASTFVGPRSHAGHRRFPPPAPTSAVRSQ